MAWQYLGRSVGSIFLAIVEYTFKACAFLAAAITIGSRGAFIEKIASGFGSLPQVLRQLPSAYRQAQQMGSVIHDYTTQTAATFTQVHGTSAIHNLMFNLSEVTQYVFNVDQNLSEATVSTLAACLIVFFTLFTVGWMVRFIRRKGKDSWRVRLEKKLWNELFDRSETQENIKIKPKQTVTEPEKATVPNIPKAVVPDPEPELEVSMSKKASRSHKPEEKGGEQERGKKPESHLTLVPKSGRKAGSGAKEDILQEKDSSGITNSDVRRRYSESVTSTITEEESVKNKNEEKSESPFREEPKGEPVKEAAGESELESELKAKIASDEATETNGTSHTGKPLNDNSEDTEKKEKEPANKEESSQITNKDEANKTSRPAKHHSLNEFLKLARSSSG